MTAPTDSAIEYHVADGIATITLNRPDKLNALTRADALELAALFDRTDADDEVRAVILTGAGRAFCAGAVVSADSFADRDAGGSPPRDWGGIVTLRIFDSLKPTIAAINGVAAGAGATIPLAMDVRLASTDARFGFVFARRGLLPESASNWFLPRIVGISRALEWCFTGRVFPAQEAHEAGLVRSLHTPDDLLPAARALAREFADGTAPVSIAITRRLMWSMLAEAHPEASHVAESALIPSRGRSADAAEGAAAFLERRRPVFPDRVSDGFPL
jgi:enoyl-CoA hydratase/carnithine racemase